MPPYPYHLLIDMVQEHHRELYQEADRRRALRESRAPSLRRGLRLPAFRRPGLGQPSRGTPAA